MTMGCAHTRSGSRPAANHEPVQAASRGRGSGSNGTREPLNFPLVSEVFYVNGLSGHGCTVSAMADRSDVPLAVRVMPELLGRVDAARGDVSRTRWVRRALERALGEALGPYSDAELRQIAAGRAASDTAVTVQEALSTGRVLVPPVVRASSLSKVGVKPIPKGKS